MGVKVYLDRRSFEKAIIKYGEGVVKTFSSRVFKDIVKTSPQKDTFSASGDYRRTGTLRDGWDIKRNSKGYIILNEVKYAPYYEYGHRTRGGGIVKGNYLMKHAVEKHLKKMGLQARKVGL